MSNSVPMPAWFPAPAENVVETDSIRDEMPYGQRLMKYVKSSSENDIAFLEYRTLHRINITHLQNELATIKSSIDNNPFPTEVELKEIRETLHTYVTAIRDFAYVESLQQIENEQAQVYRHKMTNAFFDIAELPGAPLDTSYRCLKRPASSPEDPLRAYLKKVLPRGLAYTKEEAYQRGTAYHSGQPPIFISPFVDKLARFLVALTGGVALVAPMLVMLLPSVDRTKSLATIGAAVFLFALGMSVIVRAGNTEALVATTTYAAVLVVFVGLNN